MISGCVEDGRWGWWLRGVLAFLEDLIRDLLELRVVVLEVADVGPADAVGVLVEVVVARGGESRQALVDLHLQGDEGGEGVVFGGLSLAGFLGHRRVSVLALSM